MEVISMKKAVIYLSGTGNTESMATAVAEGAGAELFSVSEFSGDITEYDAIAFGCPAMGAEVLEEDENNRNTFKCDMLITGVREVEADPERNLPAKAIVRGAIFDFRNTLMPVEFSATNPNAISYFLGLEATNSNPTFTCVWGRQISETIVKEIRTESAFGEDEIREVKNTRKDFVITGAAREPYAWDEEGSLTAAEVAEAIAARETYLATIKARQDEYKASKNAPVTPTIAANTGFNF
jgi:hypothetical protein